MTAKLKKILIIALSVCACVLIIFTVPSVRGYTYLNDLKYLVENGRVVDGEVTEWEKNESLGKKDRYFYYAIALYYQYEEDGFVWKISKNWRIKQSEIDEVEKVENWCKSQVGKTVQLVVADNGFCELADELDGLYKSQYNYVWVRGGILLALAAVVLVALVIIVLIKPKTEN